MLSHSTPSLYRKTRSKFKPFFSIDKGFSDTYRTVITQVRQNKRVTVEHFYEKILQNFHSIAGIYTPAADLSRESDCVNECSDYIVKSVGPGCYAEAANRKQRREINARHCPEYEF